MKNKYLSARVSRVPRLCPHSRARTHRKPQNRRCAAVRHKNSTEAQRSGFGRKRRCSGMDETCRLRRGEGYGACIDEKQEKGLTLFCVRPATSARSAGSFGYLRGRSKHSEKQPEGVAE